MKNLLKTVILICVLVNFSSILSAEKPIPARSVNPAYRDSFSFEMPSCISYPKKKTFSNWQSAKVRSVTPGDVQNFIHQNFTKVSTSLQEESLQSSMYRVANSNALVTFVESVDVKSDVCKEGAREDQALSILVNPTNKWATNEWQDLSKYIQEQAGEEYHKHIISRRHGHQLPILIGKAFLTESYNLKNFNFIMNVAVPGSKIEKERKSFELHFNAAYNSIFNEIAKANKEKPGVPISLVIPSIETGVFSKQIAAMHALVAIIKNVQKSELFVVENIKLILSKEDFRNYTSLVNGDKSMPLQSERDDYVLV